MDAGRFDLPSHLDGSPSVSAGITGLWHVRLLARSVQRGWASALVVPVARYFPQ